MIRLSGEQIATIRDVIRQEAGPGRRVRVFGSRLDDERRGGDLDLFLCGGQSPGGQPGVASGPYFRSTDPKHGRARCGRGVDRV